MSQHAKTRAPHPRSTTPGLRVNWPLWLDEYACDESNVLYMIEHRWLGLRKVGITTTAGRTGGYRRIDYWLAQYWELIDTIAYSDGASLRRAESLAIVRLDQLGARGTVKVEELTPTLRCGRTEMYDPERFAGDLGQLTGDELGVQLAGLPIIVPLRIAAPRSARARKAWLTRGQNRRRVTDGGPQLFAA
jgi:hypothetical protein